GRRRESVYPPVPGSQGPENSARRMVRSLPCRLASVSPHRAHASPDSARPGTLAAIAAALTLLSAPAAHASPQARLVYGRSGAAVDSCPDETALRRAVAVRIGY